jgi:hypothetical protein
VKAKMPIHRIEITEYECARCSYKWVNRINGKDGPVPIRCAKCKRTSWNRNGLIKGQENGLRRRIRGYKKLYEYASFFSSDKIHWSEDLAEKFLNLSPRPTIVELKQVVYPRDLALKPLDSQNQYSNRNFVPDPDKPGWVKYDKEEYVKLRKREARTRQEIMQHIIDSRDK